MPLSCITWNPSRFHAPMIAVSSDDAFSPGGKVILFEFIENTRRWVKIEVISFVNDPVHDIAFAPNVGRSCHLLGIASRDVKIISIKPNNNNQASNLPHPFNTQPSSLTSNHPKFEIKQVAQFNDHGTQVWRVSWNITGTILASSGDDGCVRLWKGKNFF
jgi:nucleoporin seh1